MPLRPHASFRRGPGDLRDPRTAGGDGEPTGALIEAAGLSCFRGDRLLFSGLDFALGPGRALHLRGPNGSGKTTLLRVLCGLTLPEAGEIHWLGEPRPPRTGAVLGYVGHSDGIKLELSPRENLAMARALSGGAPGGAPGGDIEAALASFGLAGFADVPCRTLSAGQRRRIALARLLLGGARVWILDEPFTALDTRAAATLYALIEGHLAEGGGVLLTSHHPLELDPATSSVLELRP